MANDYSTSSDAFATMSEANYSSSDYPFMATAITAASRLIDGEFGRQAGFFAPTTDDVTWYFDGSGTDIQEIGEWVSITSVSVSEQGETASTGYTTWSSTCYLTEPYNETPITKLVIDSNGDKLAFYDYRKAVKVVGVAGYSSTAPDVIKLACNIQACRWFMRAKQGWRDAGGEEETPTYKGFTALDPDVKLLLYPLKLELMNG